MGAVGGLLVALLSALVGLAPAPVRAAEIEVSGSGWWSNRELRRTVELLVRPEQAATLEAGAIEDAALILISELQDDGYLRPKVTAVIHPEADPEVPNTNKGVEEYTWDETLTTLLPRPLAAERVAFRLAPGVRYEVTEVELEGLTVLTESEGDAYFRAENYLLPLASTRLYTPQRFERGQANLQEELRQRGYAAATVHGEATRDDESGAVRLHVVVNEGPRSVVEQLALAAPVEPAPPEDLFRRAAHRPYSPLWEQAFLERAYAHYHELGYMDARVELAPAIGEVREGERSVTVQVRIAPGVRVLAGPVRFAGGDAVRRAVLERQVKVPAGEPLNPTAVAQARERLIRLGVFRGVDVDYDPEDGPVRSPVFTLTPGREQDLNLLAGWGSYERLRGGLEYRHYNVFSRAHQVRADLVQSLKSSRGEASYTVPGLFGENIDGTATLFGLRREERSFRREEYGGSVGVKRHFRTLGGDVSATYTYESLRGADSTLGATAGDLTTAKVASVDLTFLRDRQDNPLRPRRGYRVYVRSELAAKALGGEVDYQRVELGYTQHWRLGRGRWIHAGASHGAITTYGGEGAGLPINKRFFPGGENSVRGFSEGGAAPRAEDGTYLGAKSYLLLNLEFEQALTRSWSAVLFTDGIGVASALRDYPFDQTLVSVGVGVRYHSLIGPIRLEYGHNLNPRAEDPAGAVHFSVGFPF